MKKIFLAAPFKSLVDEKTNKMENNSKNQIVAFIAYLENKGFSVHNAHKREAWGENFMPPAQCTQIDYEEIEKCDILIAFPGNPPSPGTHIELGWASALKKRIIILIKDDFENYAYLVRGLHKVADVTYILYRTEEDYYRELENLL